MSHSSANEDTLFGLLKRFAALRRAPKTSKGKYHAPTSPYKPILLLTVLRRIQQGRHSYAQNRIDYDACEQDFRTLYSRLYGETDNIGSKVAQAYWYLGAGSPQVWTLVPKAGKEAELSKLIAEHAQIKTPTKLKTFVSMASFGENDWNVLTDQDVQRALIYFLISEHFADIRREIETL
jgi:predicted restriction endonuclease